MTRHRFVNDGLTPIPMGSDAVYMCVCGRTGARESIDRHITESNLFEAEDFSGGDTKAHYLPVEPRGPGPKTNPPSFSERDPSAPELPPLPPRGSECTICGMGTTIAVLPEIAAWTCGHWIRKSPRPIAEAFQEMLRSAFEAGIASATSGEDFERWYQREVLQ